MSAVSAALLLSVMSQGEVPEPVAPPAVWGLTWNSPPDCIRPADLAERIERARGGTALFGAHAVLRLEGRIGPDQGGWRARLTLVDKQGTVMGTRELQSTDAECRAIDERLVLVASVLMDTVLKPATPLPPVVKPLVAKAPVALRPPMVAPPDFPFLEVTAESHYFQGNSIGVEGFYRRAGRVDLIDDLHARQMGRVVGFTGGGLAMLTGGILLGGYALGLGCSHYSGNQTLHGTCLEPSVPVLVTSLVLLGVGGLSLLVASQVAPTPTTFKEDTEIAALANKQVIERAKASQPKPPAPVPGAHDADDQTRHPD